MNTRRESQGVSLYSYQEEYFLRTMSLEQCIAAAAAAGARGIESIAEQMMPGFPRLPDAFYDQWRGWMDKYGTTPTAHDAMLDTKKYKGRLLTDEECMVEFERDLRHAAKLGCKVVRALCMVSPRSWPRPCRSPSATTSRWVSRCTRRTISTTRGSCGTSKRPSASARSTTVSSPTWESSRSACPAWRATTERSVGRRRS